MYENVRVTELALPSLEMPKSMTFTALVPSFLAASTRLDGLMSRWTMPMSCAAATPEHAWMT